MCNGVGTPQRVQKCRLHVVCTLEARVMFCVPSGYPKYMGCLVVQAAKGLDVNKTVSVLYHITVYKVLKNFNYSTYY